MVHRKIIFQYLIKDREKKNQKQKSNEKSTKLSKIQNFGQHKGITERKETERNKEKNQT